MSNKLPSLINQPQQQDLIEVETVEQIDVKRRPIYTGARFFAKNPKAYRAIIKLSAAYPPCEIADLLEVSEHTVNAVQVREAASVAERKEDLATRCLRGARLSVEEIIHRLSDPEERKRIPANVLGPWAGILAEKHELLTGGATARVEHTTTDSDANAWAKFSATLKVIQMDSSAGKVAEKEAGRLMGTSLAGELEAVAKAAEMAIRQPAVKLLTGGDQDV